MLNTVEGCLDTITLREIVNFIGGIIVVISLVIEFSKKIPFNPWSNILSLVGKALTKDLTTKLETVEEQTKANNKAIVELENVVERKFKEKEISDDEKEAKRLRANIICFADSCRVSNHHTQNHFENIMRDYDDYEAYCEKHGIPNSLIDSEMVYIRSIYQKCLKENKFL